MKHIISLQILFFFVYSLLNGQQSSLGIKPGFLLVGARSVNPDHFETFGASYAVGVSWNNQINRRFGLKIEPGFIVKGHNSKWEDPLNHKDYVHKYRNHFLSVPVSFYYSVKQNLNIEFGPEICYRLYALEKSSQEKSYSRRHDKWNLKRRVELSLISGISYTFLNKYDLGVRFGYGLTPFQRGIDLWAPYYRIYEYYSEFYLNTRLFAKVKNSI